jgi:hypothetical protein
LENGGGRTAYVLFKEFSDREIYLAFDDIRIHEAIWCLLSAQGIYADDPRGFSFKAEDVSIQSMGDDTILHVKFKADGPTMAIRLSKDALQRLKDRLK